MESNRFEETTKVTIISILWNIVLTIIKVLGGILGKSNAMIADGLHSASDIISSIGVLIGNHIAKTPNDKEHNYGHEKAETLVSFLLSILLIFVSLKISLGGINSLFHLNEVKIPTILPLVISFSASNLILLDPFLNLKKLIKFGFKKSNRLVVPPLPIFTISCSVSFVL